MAGLPAIGPAGFLEHHGPRGRPAINARVIGRWYDDAGQPTGRAALLLSDRGAFLSHVILADDREGKKQMLAGAAGPFLAAALASDGPGGN